MYLQQEELARLSRGSVEDFMVHVLEKANAQTKEPLSIFATHKDHAFAVCGDKVLRLEWSGTPEDMAVKISDAGVALTPLAADGPRGIADQIRLAVEQIMDPKAVIDRNRLRSIAMSIRESAGYWVTDLVARIEESERSARDQLAKASSTITEAKRETLLAGIPKTPYARFGREALPSFEKELRGSFVHMIEMADLYARQKPRVASQLAELAETGDAILSLADDDELTELARGHDLFASALGQVILINGKFETGTKQ